MPTTKDTPRSIRFSQRLWDEIDRDAERCKRSANKQIAAILETYFGISDSGINMQNLEVLAHQSDVIKTKEDVMNGQELSPTGNPISHYEPKGGKGRKVA